MNDSSNAQTAPRADRSPACRAAAGAARRPACRAAGCPASTTQLRDLAGRQPLTRAHALHQANRKSMTSVMSSRHHRGTEAPRTRSCPSERSVPRCLGGSSPRVRVMASATRVASASASRPSWPVTPGGRPVRTASDEVLELALERLFVRHVERARPGSTGRPSLRHEAVHLDLLRGVVDRHVRAPLEEPRLAHAVAADAARRHVRDAPDANRSRAFAMSARGVSTFTPTASIATTSDRTTASSRSRS